MTLNRSFKLVAPLGLALLAGCFTANLASAGSFYNGRFTLPVEARWGQVVLSPGNYFFTLDNAANMRIVTVWQGTNAVDMIFSEAIDYSQAFDNSELILVRSGGNYTIRALRLVSLGQTLEYSVPKSGRQLITQKPQLLERVPVMMGG
jgi:hypothetical protein